MAISGFPVFADDQVLTAAQLNALTGVISTKFSGNVGGADFQNPLTLPGNLNMNFNSIVNLPRFWKVYNLTETTSTPQQVINAAIADGGGMIFLDPATTVTFHSITANASGGNANLVFLGAGPSSIITDSTAGGNMFQNTTAADTGFTFINLRFRGNSLATDGLAFRNARRVKFINCEFDGFVGSPIRLTNATAAGQSTNDVEIVGCRFTTSGVSHIELVDASNVRIHDCIFDNTSAGGTGSAVRSSVASTNNVVRRVFIYRNSIRQNSLAAPGVAILFTSSASATANQAQVWVTDNELDGQSTDGKCQIKFSIWREFFVERNHIHDCTGSATTPPAIHVASGSDSFTIVDNVIERYDGDGIVIGPSAGSEITFATRVQSGNPQHFRCVGNRLYTMGLCGIVVSRPICMTLANNLVSGTGAQQASAPQTTQRYAFEFWNLGDGAATSFNFGGSTVTGNSGTSSTTAGTLSNGLETYQTLGCGGTANAAVGGAGAGNINLILFNNVFTGMTAADFTELVAKNLFLGGTVPSVTLGQNII